MDNPYARKYLTTNKDRATKKKVTSMNNTPDEYKGDVAQDPANYEEWATTEEGKMTIN